VLVELKKGGNSKTGAISELLFYASVMRDVLLGKFQFEKRATPRNCVISPQDIRCCSKIRAILAAPELHPLIRDMSILGELNAATAKYWNALPVHFGALLIAGYPNSNADDFAFIK
jgi:hypothetical protein